MYEVRLFNGKCYVKEQYLVGTLKFLLDCYPEISHSICEKRVILKEASPTMQKEPYCIEEVDRDTVILYVEVY